MAAKFIEEINQNILDLPHTRRVLQHLVIALITVDFSSGGKNILKLYLSISIVTDGKNCLK